MNHYNPYDTFQHNWENPHFDLFHHHHHHHHKDTQTVDAAISIDTATTITNNFQPDAVEFSVAAIDGFNH